MCLRAHIYVFVRIKIQRFKSFIYHVTRPLLLARPKYITSYQAKSFISNQLHYITKFRFHITANKELVYTPYVRNKYITSSVLEREHSGCCKRAMVIVALRRYATVASTESIALFVTPSRNRQRVLGSSAPPETPGLS